MSIMANNVTLHAADLLDGLNEIVFQTDPHGNWTYLNQAWTRVTGFLVEDCLGRNFLEYVHPDERQQTIELFTAVVSGGANVLSSRRAAIEPPRATSPGWSFAPRFATTTPV